MYSSIQCKRWNMKDKDKKEKKEKEVKDIRLKDEKNRRNGVLTTEEIFEIMQDAFN